MVPASRRKQIDAVASTIDIAPTLLDLAAIAEPAGVQGESLVATLTGGMAPMRTCALTENDDDFVPMKMRVLTTDRWKLVYYVNAEHGELYDRHADPAEMTNRWWHSDYAETRQRLLQMLLEQVICGQDMSNGRVQSPNPVPPKWNA